MKKLVLKYSLLAVVCGSMIAAVAPAQAASIAWRSSVPAALQEAKKSGKPVFIDFTATWCGPCLEMKKTTFKDAKVLSELKKWVSVSVDVDKQEKVAGQYKVEAMPTLMVVKPNGTVVSKAVGFQESGELLKWLRAHYVKARK